MYMFERVLLPLIGVALTTYSVRKWPEDKSTCIIPVFEKFLVGVRQIMLTNPKTVSIAAKLRSNGDKYST